MEARILFFAVIILLLFLWNRKKGYECALLVDLRATPKPENHNNETRLETGFWLLGSTQRQTRHCRIYYQTNNQTTSHLSQHRWLSATSRQVICILGWLVAAHDYIVNPSGLVGLGLALKICIHRNISECFPYWFVERLERHKSNMATVESIAFSIVRIICKAIPLVREF